jgi:hypothetical protein
VGQDIAMIAKYLLTKSYVLLSEFIGQSYSSAALAVSSAVLSVLPADL